MKTFSMTDVGKVREMNQDYVFTSETAVGKLPNLFLVADGVGGHKAGEYASRAAVETIVQSIMESETKQPVSLLKKAITQANQKLLRESITDIEKEGMGTTVVAATLIGNKLIAANVGDSRLYLINEKSITQITRDHSYVEELVRSGRLKRTDARNHPYKNRITRAVGVQPELDIDFFEVELQEQDIILMCTDGLTNMVEDTDIKRIVLSQRDAVEKTLTLIREANRNGGKDNISVLLIEPFT